MSEDKQDLLSIGHLSDGRVVIFVRSADGVTTTELRMPPDRARQIAELLMTAAEQSGAVKP